MRVRSYLMILAIACGGGGLALSAVLRMHQEQVVEAVLEVEEALQLRHDAQRFGDSVRQVFLTSDLLFGALETYMLAPLQQQLEGARGRLELLEQHTPEAWRKIRAPLALLNEQIAALDQEAARFGSDAVRGERNNNAEQLQRVDALSLSIIAATESLVGAVDQRVQLSRENEQQLRRSERSLLVPAGLLYGFVVLAVLIWMTRSLSRPIGRLADNATRALQDYDSFQPEAEGPQEVISLTTALETLIESLKRQIRNTRALIDAIPDSLLLVRRSGEIVYSKLAGGAVAEDASDERPEAYFHRMLGSDGQQALKEALAECVDQSESRLLELNLKLPGGPRVFELRLAPASGDTAVLVVRDLTEAKAAEKRVRELAFRDGLTGLMNRTAFMELIARRIRDAQDRPFGLLFIDLDRFKWVNDTQGHEAGDFVLKIVAQRISRALRGEDEFAFGDRHPDSSARIGGDEFLVLLPDVQSADALLRISERVLSRVTKPIEVDGQTVAVGASVGCVRYPLNGISAEALIRNADAAMYEAKRNGGNSPQLFNEQLGSRNQRLLKMESRFRAALDRDELVLHYQPQLTLTGLKLAGVEALVRWQDGELLRSPGEFVPLAESSGLIHVLGQQVLDLSLAQLARWDQAGFAVPGVGVNVSGLQFRNDGVIKGTIESLVRHGLDPDRLVLEVTESVLLDEAFSPLSQLQELREAGVRIALDDFGTGYSSLSHLRSLPIDILKIDRQFVRGMSSEEDLQHIVRMIIELGQRLGMQVLAEGVEDADEEALLKRFCCDEVQGYYYARPLAAEALEAMLRDRGDALLSAG